MSAIEDLERKVQSLRDQLHAAEKSLLEARIAICGVKIGDLVRHTRTQVVYRVVEIEPFLGKFWLEGNPQRKDGSFGTARRRMYSDWEAVQSESTR